MATLTVEGKQYDLDSLSVEAKANASAITFTDSKIKQLEQELMMARAARAFYVSELIKSLPSEEKTPAKKTATRKRSTTAKSTAAKSTAATKTSTRSKTAAK